MNSGRLANIPEELKERRQWVCWRKIERDGKATKVPFTADFSGRHASTTDPTTWATFDEACAAARRFHGIGYVFSPDDPYTGIDLDHCLANGEVLDWAVDYVAALAPSYAEISPSGTGIHFFVRARLPGDGTRKNGFGVDRLGAVEMYTQARYFTVTGHRWDDTECEAIDRQAAVEALYATLKGPAPVDPAAEAPAEPAASPGAWRPATADLTDEEIVAALTARGAKSLDPDVQMFRALYLIGDTAVVGDDDSSADYALCKILAKWVGDDPDRIERIFNQSPLANREKWTSRGKYRSSTIRKAIGFARMSACSKGDITTTTTTKEAFRGASGNLYQFPLILRGQDVVPKVVHWLWQDRIPFGFLTLLAGRTGVGKSFITLDVAARLSFGGEIPGGKGECFAPASTLIIGEDSHEYVLSPRLIEAGADMSRIAFMSWQAMAEYSLGDSQMLDDTYQAAGCPRLVVIDPPTNFLGGKDEHKNAEVRGILMHVSIWAMTNAVAVVLITHCNKGNKKDLEALDRVIGSVAWASTSRIAHLLAPHPDEEGQGVFLPLKSNISRMARGIAYRIVPTTTVARVDWLGAVDLAPEDALGGREKVPRGMLAVEWLAEQFRKARTYRSDDLKRMAAEAGISKNALWSPEATALPIRKHKNSGADGEIFYVWEAQPGWPPPPKETG